MSKVFAIIGKSYSGKDTLLNYILNDCKDFCERNNLHKLVRYTTRKMRPNEVEGKDYYFISDDQWEKEFANNENVHTAEYYTEFGTWYYTTDFSKLESDKNYITVADILDIPRYKRILGDNLCVIYLIPPNWSIFGRFGKRADNSNYISNRYKEIYRRFMDDLIKFGNMSDVCLSGVTCIINLGQTVMHNTIKMLINGFIEDSVKSSRILNFNNPLHKVKKIDNGNIADVICYYNYDFKYKDIINGQIDMLNGRLKLYTESETYDYSGK